MNRRSVRGSLPVVSKIPRTSILLPVFEAVNTLPACLHSIQRQTDPDWECVLVDDGSTDGGLAAANEIATADPRFRVIARPHRGLVSTLRDGLEHCRGQYVARMDADDWMLRRRIECQVAALERNPAIAAVGCHVRIFPRRDLRDGTRNYERWLNEIDAPHRVRENAFVECPIAHPTLMIRRDLLTTLGYRDCGWAEDYDLVLRLLAAGHELSVVPQRLLAWRDSPKRLSRTSETYSLERFTACKAAHLAKSFLAESDDYTLWGYGGTGRRLQRALREHGKRPALILELHPGRIGNVIAGASVLHPDDWLRSPRHRLVVSVAGSTARKQIRDVLDRAGLRETIDYVCAA
jgi:glycosyltransferase involved in cell wall biosynthesis